MSQLPATSRLAQLEASIRADHANAARRIWSIGNAMLEVRRDELWRQRDCKSFHDWLRRYCDMSRSAAYRAMQIAEQFSGEQAALYGTDKLNAASHYLGATKQQEAPGALSALQLRVRGEGGTWDTVPFAEASPETIRAAAREVSETQSRRQVPKALRERMAQLSVALPTVTKKASKSRVRVARHRSGRLVATFKEVPVDEMPAFIAMLQAHWGEGGGE